MTEASSGFPQPLLDPSTVLLLWEEEKNYNKKTAVVFGTLTHFRSSRKGGNKENEQVTAEAERAYG